LELKFHFSGRDGKRAAGSQLVVSTKGFAVDSAGSHIVNATKARDAIPSHGVSPVALSVAAARRSVRAMQVGGTIRGLACCSDAVNLSRHFSDFLRGNCGRLKHRPSALF
jgi:hypothetical protein